MYEYSIKVEYSLTDKGKGFEPVLLRTISKSELIPSAKALKYIGMGFEQAIVFIDYIKEKAQKEMIDEKAAAWRLAQELRQWQEFGGLEKAFSTATNQLSLLNTTLEQQKQAIGTLVHLQKIVITEAEIWQLVKLVGWSGVSKNNGDNMTTNSSSEFVGGKKLDDKLIGVGS